MSDISEVDFTNSHILNDGGFSVLTSYSGVPKTLDLSGNYWGTDNPDSIDAWIWDSNDPEWPEPDVDCEIIYKPFSTAPLPTQQQTHGGLRRMFR